MENEKLKELREKFEKIQELEDSSDLSPISIVDRREPEQPKKEYENSLEGDLMQELDETRDYEERLSIIERIKEARKIQKEKASQELVKEAQKEQENIQEQIAEKRKKVEELKDKSKEFRKQEQEYLKEIMENEGIMKIKKAKPSSKIYISAKEENEELIKLKRDKLSEIEKNENEIKELETQVQGLNDLVLVFDDFLCEIQGKERKPQEQPKKEKSKKDEMWEQYRAEQEKAKQERIRKRLEMMNEFSKKSAEEVKAERTETPKAEAPRTETPKAETPRTETPRTEIPKTGTPRTEIPKTGVPRTEKPAQKNSVTSEEKRDDGSIVLKEAGFYITPEGIPVYSAIIAKDGKVERKEVNALQYIQIAKIKDIRRLREIGIKEPRLFDLGLNEFLLKELGKQASTEYINAMKKDAKIEERTFDIYYNFHNDGIHSPKQAIKLGYLRNLAKKSKEKELAVFTDRDKILKRLFKKIKSIKLLPEKTTSTKVNEEGSLTDQELDRIFHELHNEPGFDVDVFIEQNNLPKETAEKYRKFGTEENRKVADQKRKEFEKRVKILMGEERSKEFINPTGYVPKKTSTTVVKTQRPKELSREDED